MPEAAHTVSAPAQTDHVIVVFDGVCVLCNHTVDLLLRTDGSGRLRFTPFQGHNAARLLAEHGVFTAPDTVYIIDGRGLYERSDAIIYVSRYLVWPWRAVGALRAIPRSLRDPIYRWISRNRYRWFGKRDTCRLPTQEERDRFL
jgi:predicted DCC family thiol-disulfide oxidoreductase YuxK